MDESFYMRGKELKCRNILVEGRYVSLLSMMAMNNGVGSGTVRGNFVKNGL